ncbi:MAG: hypothetical protein R3B96_02455 [Pirellulaceae bacterium]
MRRIRIDPESVDSDFAMLKIDIQSEYTSEGRVLCKANGTEGCCLDRQQGRVLMLCFLGGLEQRLESGEPRNELYRIAMARKSRSRGSKPSLEAPSYGTILSTGHFHSGDLARHRVWAVRRIPGRTRCLPMAVG